MRNEKAKPAFEASSGAQKPGSESGPRFGRVATKTNADCRTTKPDTLHAFETTLGGLLRGARQKRELAIPRPGPPPTRDLAKNLGSIAHAPPGILPAFNQALQKHRATEQHKPNRSLQGLPHFAETCARPQPVARGRHGGLENGDMAR